jgi:hypothetical protein
MRQHSAAVPANASGMQAANMLNYISHIVWCFNCLLQLFPAPTQDLEPIIPRQLAEAEIAVAEEAAANLQCAVVRSSFC